MAIAKAAVCARVVRHKHRIKDGIAAWTEMRSHPLRSGTRRQKTGSRMVKVDAKRPA
jgi:hypothetical protein